MRKIKLELRCRVPSWGYCNYDGFTADNRFSKDLCRFCVKDKTGHRCVLHDCSLKADKDFVYKTPDCIEATAGYAITVDEPTPQSPVVDPKLIISETFKIYNKTVESLVKQGYPRAMAEKVAQQDILRGK